jgi:thiol-disulfide isomerase/thioredoxin
MKSKFFVRILCLFVMFMALISACSRKQSAELEIKQGLAQIEGKIMGSVPAELKGETVAFSLLLSNPVTGNIDEYETTLSDEGTFCFKIPVFCSAIGYIRSKIYSGRIGLASGEKTKLEIFFDESEEIQVNMESCTGLTSDDMQYLGTVMMDVFQYPVAYDSINHPLNMQPDTFSRFVISYMENILEKLITNNTELSENAKQYAYRYSKLYYLRSDLLDYENTMRLAYLNKRREGKNKEEVFTPVNPDKSYYSFLDYFDLNNPQYLYPYCEEYFKVLRSILVNKTLGIPRIESAPVSDWLEEVKAILAKLIGSDTGLFYDLLVVNAYAKQFTEENKPLSETQKENIKRYFKNELLTNVLLKENEKLMETTRKNKKLKNETPDVDKEVLMDAIVSKYKGKVVLVDFWATWCGPCLEAMYELKETKHEMKDKDIVFVYITDTSSPRGTWEKKISEIGGEHYYLDRGEWEYLLDSFGFSGIPTYLFYDSKGALKNKITGYPGTDEMRKMIEELLP